jgi:hypothetical protein
MKGLVFRHDIRNDHRWETLMESQAKKAFDLADGQVRQHMREGWIVQVLLGDLFYKGGPHGSLGPKDWVPRKAELLDLDDVVRIMEAAREGLLPRYMEFMTDIVRPALLEAATPNADDMAVALDEAVWFMSRFGSTYDENLLDPLKEGEDIGDSEILTTLMSWTSSDGHELLWMPGTSSIVSALKSYTHKALVTSGEWKKRLVVELRRIFKVLVDKFWSEFNIRMDTVNILHRYNTWPGVFSEAVKHDPMAKVVRDEMVRFVRRSS